MKYCYQCVYHIEFDFENQLARDIISEKRSHFLWFLFSGPIQAGKTSFLRQILPELQKQGLRVNGILSLAHFQGGELRGYNAFDLQNQKTFPLLRIHPAKNWLRVGSFGMIPEGLNQAEQAILRFQGSDLTIIDEIGPLELSGSGFWPSFCRLREQNQPTLVVVRESLVLRLQESCSRPASHFQLSAPGLENVMTHHLLSLKTS